jgi:hypothetical protein
LTPEQERELLELLRQLLAEMRKANAQLADIASSVGNLG